MHRLDRLVYVLSLMGYKFLDRLDKYHTILDVPVQDFICIVSLMANMACRPFLRKAPFPKLYQKEKFRVTGDEQTRCCDLLIALAERIHFPHKITKSSIISSATRTYSEHRAEYLMLMCDYVDQIFATPATSPSSSVNSSPER